MKVVGLMSGTSADGINAALCELENAPPHLQARVLFALECPWGDMQQRILAACDPAVGRVDEICRLNVAVGEAFARAALSVIQASGLTAADVDLIGSHGQTVWHEVLADGRVSATLQLGSAAVIAERTGITTISDFRLRDVAAGGQGAPLTAYVDWLLLRDESRWRAVQNIGGMGNVTFLPPLADRDSPPLAFDTGPGNALIDAAVYRLTGGRLTYDRDGALAAAGQVIPEALATLLAHPYFQRPPPKTTGRELFGANLAHQWIERMQPSNPADIVATFTALTAHSIADAYRRFAPAPPHQVILGGGGRRNPVLIRMLRDLLRPAEILLHEDVGSDSDAKEALVFALLAYETWFNRPGTLAVLTGPAHPTVLGHITPGTNYAQLIRQTWK